MLVCWCCCCCGSSAPNRDFEERFYIGFFPTSTIYFCSVVQQLFRFRLLLITHIVRTLFLHFSVTYVQISDFCIFFWFLVVFVLNFSKYYELGLITVYVSIICNDFICVSNLSLKMAWLRTRLLIRVCVFVLGNCGSVVCCVFEV